MFFDMLKYTYSESLFKYTIHLNKTQMLKKFP